MEQLAQRFDGAKITWGVVARLVLFAPLIILRLLLIMGILLLTWCLIRLITLGTRVTKNAPLPWGQKRAVG